MGSELLREPALLFEPVDDLGGKFHILWPTGDDGGGERSKALPPTLALPTSCGRGSQAAKPGLSGLGGLPGRLFPWQRAEPLTPLEEARLENSHPVPHKGKSLYLLRSISCRYNCCRCFLGGPGPLVRLAPAWGPSLMPGQLPCCSPCTASSPPGGSAWRGTQAPPQEELNLGTLHRSISPGTCFREHGMNRLSRAWTLGRSSLLESGHISSRADSAAGMMRVLAWPA